MPTIPIVDPGAIPTAPPRPNEETQPYWDATGQGRLLMRRCPACGFVNWPPRELCPECHLVGAEWFESDGRGHIYSFSVNRKGMGSWAQVTPYVLAYVELDDGPRLLTNIVECDPDAVRIGDRVDPVFHATGEGTSVLRFRPAAPPS